MSLFRIGVTIHNHGENILILEYSNYLYYANSRVYYTILPPDCDVFKHMEPGK